MDHSFPVEERPTLINYGKHSEAKFLEKVRHVRTKIESTLTFKNLILMFQVVIKPCLKAYHSALLLEANPM